MFCTYVNTRGLLIRSELVVHCQSDDLRKEMQADVYLCMQSCSLATGIDEKLNATVGAAFKQSDIFGKAKPESSTEVLFVFDDKPDILNTTQIGEQLQNQFESVLGQINALVSGNASLVLNGLSTSLGEPQPSDVTAVDATAPAISFLMDELSHALP